MLARPDAYRCVECGLPYRSDAFHHYHGRIEDGPAYWSDRGILCSPRCSLEHHRRRAREGSLASMPAPDPFDPAVIRPTDDR